MAFSKALSGVSVELLGNKELIAALAVRGERGGVPEGADPLLNE